MSDPMTIAAGLSSIKAALDITRTLSDARDTANLLSVKLELQTLLLEAQEAQATLAEEKRALEERIRRMETWDREKDRYQLVEVVPGAFAYALKAGADADEPAHYACANCFEHRRRSVLTRVYIPAGRAEMLRCQPCGFEIITKGVDHRPNSAAGTAGFRPLN